MDQSTSAEGLIALLERDVQNLQNSIDKLVESNQELKTEIKDGKDEDRIYLSAIEVSLDCQRQTKLTSPSPSLITHHHST